MLTHNHMKTHARKLGIDKVYLHDLSSQNYWDETGALGDLVLTTT
jgi:N-acetylglutamate synthase-like GNAT family acetyltransferase